MGLPCSDNCVGEIDGSTVLRYLCVGEIDGSTVL